jgi:hypothetical protein
MLLVSCDSEIQGQICFETLKETQGAQQESRNVYVMLAWYI